MTGDAATWIAYGLGQAFHILLQTDAIARAKNNPADKRTEIIRTNVKRLAARIFAATCLFVFFWHNPAGLATLLTFVGVTLSENVAAVLTQNWPLAGLYGLASDVLLSFIPGLKNATAPAEEKE